MPVKKIFRMTTHHASPINRLNNFQAFEAAMQLYYSLLDDLFDTVELGRESSFCPLPVNVNLKQIFFELSKVFITFLVICNLINVLLLLK